MLKVLLVKLLHKRFAKLAVGGVGAILAAIGGLTSIGALQGAVEKASDYAASAAALYCEFPRVDRERFRSELLERLAAQPLAKGSAIDVRVVCPIDLETL